MLSLVLYAAKNSTLRGHLATESGGNVWGAINRNSQARLCFHFCHTQGHKKGNWGVIQQSQQHPVLRLSKPKVTILLSRMYQQPHHDAIALKRADFIRNAWMLKELFTF